MQIQFDPRDPSQLAMVARIVDACSGGNAFASAPTAVPDAPASTSGATDAASAFDTPPAPPAQPATPTGGDASDPDDDEPATPAVPVSAPGDDTDDEQGNAATDVTGTAPAAPAPGASPNGVETDADGLPWDERIHSGPKDKKPKNADGTWRRKRGMGDDDKAEFVKSVEAELRQIMAAGGNAPNVADGQAPAAPAAPAPTAAPTPPVPTPPDAGTASGPDVATTADSAPPAPPAQPATPPAEPAADAGELTFPALMRKITALQSSGALTVQGTNDIAVSLGLTSVRDLVHRPDMVASFAALLPEQGAE